MKRKSWIAAGCLFLACMTACGQKGTVAESKWKEAKKADDIGAYVTEHREDLDVEVLKAEAEDANATLSQQAKAIALLSMIEYQDNLSANSSPNISGRDTDDVFLFDYPISSAYADSYFAKVNTDEAAFWESIKDGIYPCDYFWTMLAAAEELDGETLAKLNQNVPEDSYDTQLKDAIKDWVKHKPGKAPKVSDALIDIGYYDDWSRDDWKGTYLGNTLVPYVVKAETAEDGLAYIRYMRSTLLPIMEATITEGKLIEGDLKHTSDITEEQYYDTGLTVMIKEDLALEEPADTGDAEPVDLEGKTVLALYHNPASEEYADAPPAWMVLGDFMLEIPEEEVPSSVAEADYYFVLTADHQFGDYYYDQSGNPTKIQAVYSSTSVDLYDAATGALIRHVGNVMEDAPSTIFKDMSEESVQYPELTGADTLVYIYHNLNNPDSYTTLLDHTSALEAPLVKGQTALLGAWEITFDSCEIVKSFDEGLFNYTASDGCQFVRGGFTITNRGSKMATFIPRSSIDTSKDVYAGVMDAAGDNYYPTVDAMTNSKCLIGATLEPGETESGELLFEVEDSVLGTGEPLYIAFSLGNQMLLYSTEE